MNARSLLVAAAATLALFSASGAAYAQGSGSGSTQTGQSTTTGGLTEAAPCIQRGPDGKPVEKLSSEEVCPMYQFWRDDCRRSGAAGLASAGEHCSLAAMGMRREDPVATGSLAPVTP